MSNYNLDEQAAESFPFTLKGHQYEMRYPTTEELEDVPQAPDTTKLDDAQKLKANKDYTEKLNAYFYGFIKCADDGPAVEEALKKANILTLRHFAVMIKTELSLDV